MRVGTKSELALAVEILRRAEFTDDGVQEAVQTVHTHLGRLMGALSDGEPIFSRLDYSYAPPIATPAEGGGATILHFPLKHRRAQGD